MEGVATGTITVQMEVKENIPSKVMIKGHSCLIFYNGQQWTGFICQFFDHQTKNCPKRKGQQTVDDNRPRTSEFQPPSSQEVDIYVLNTTLQLRKLINSRNPRIRHHDTFPTLP